MQSWRSVRQAGVGRNDLVAAGFRPLDRVATSAAPSMETHLRMIRDSTDYDEGLRHCQALIVGYGDRYPEAMALVAEVLANWLAERQPAGRSGRPA